MSISSGAVDRKTFLRGLGFAVLATLLWSGNFIVARGLHKSVPPVSMAFFRWLVATVVLFPIAFKKLKEDAHLLRRHLPYLALAALSGVTLFNTLIYLAGKHTSAINLALIGTTASPVFVLLISALILRAKIHWTQVLGALICILGILVLISKGNISQLGQLKFNKGDGLVLGAGLSFAIYTVLVRRMPKELSGLSFLFSVFFIGTLFLLPAFLWERSTGAGFGWNSTIVAVFLYLGIGASVISFLSWNTSIRAIGSARTSLFGNLIPVFSSIEAALILKEPFGWATGASLLIILTGLLVANAKVFAGAK